MKIEPITVKTQPDISMFTEENNCEQ